MLAFDDAVDQAVAETTEATVTHKSKGGEYQRKQKEKRVAAATKIQEYFNNNGGVPEELKADLDFLLGQGQRQVGPREDLFVKLFPEGTDAISTFDVFKRTGKGYADMRKLFKQWKEKRGIVVEIDQEKAEYRVISRG